MESTKTMVNDYTQFYQKIIPSSLESFSSRLKTISFRQATEMSLVIDITEKHYGESAYGNLHVETTAWKPLEKELIEGIKELGYETIDLNGPQRSGTFYQFLQHTDI